MQIMCFKPPVSMKKSKKAGPWQWEWGVLFKSLRAHSLSSSLWGDGGLSRVGSRS